MRTDETNSKLAFIILINPLQTFGNLFVPLKVTCNMGNTLFINFHDKCLQKLEIFHKF